MSIKCKLYKLALWYIGKCNAKWSKLSYTEMVKSLDKLTYKNSDKYYLSYGADAEWQNFARYDVLDNAIQRLGQYEDSKQQASEKFMDEFIESLMIVRDRYIDDCMVQKMMAIDEMLNLAKEAKGRS